MSRNEDAGCRPLRHPDQRVFFGSPCWLAATTTAMIVFQSYLKRGQLASKA